MLVRLEATGKNLQDFVDKTIWNSVLTNVMHVGEKGTFIIYTIGSGTRSEFESMKTWN